jgi:MFS family permease
MITSDFDQDRSDAQTRQRDMDEGRDITPIPWGQLLIILLAQFAEPITGIVIFPFINQFVRETGITGGDEMRTGYFAGIIVRAWLFNHVHFNFETTFQESMFYIAEGSTVILWSMASDRFGRRCVMILGPLGLSLTTLGFGASTQFWFLMMFRFLQGVFNGTTGLSLCGYNLWLLTL